MLGELWRNMLKSSTEGVVGVLAIFTYLGVLLAAACYRIRQGDYLDPDDPEHLETLAPQDGCGGDAGCTRDALASTADQAGSPGSSATSAR